jgi:hypothetical protein
LNNAEALVAPAQSAAAAIAEIGGFVEFALTDFFGDLMVAELMAVQDLLVTTANTAVER